MCRKLESIRRLTKYDLPQVFALCSDYLGSSFNWSQQALEGEFASGRFYGLFSAEVLNSFVCCQRRGGDVLELTTLATRKGATQKGSMLKLLQWLIASQTGWSKMWLEVHPQNISARNLYRKLGFVEKGERSNYYSDGSAAILCTFTK